MSSEEYINTHLEMVRIRSISVLPIETASFTTLLLLLLYRYSKLYNNDIEQIVSIRNLKPNSWETQLLYRTIGLL